MGVPFFPLFVSFFNQGVDAAFKEFGDFDVVGDVEAFFFGCGDEGDFFDYEGSDCA